MEAEETSLDASLEAECVTSQQHADSVPEEVAEGAGPLESVIDNASFGKAVEEPELLQQEEEEKDAAGEIATFDGTAASADLDGNAADSGEAGSQQASESLPLSPAAQTQQTAQKLDQSVMEITMQQQQFQLSYL